MDSKPWYPASVARVVQETPVDRTFFFDIPPAHRPPLRLGAGPARDAPRAHRGAADTPGRTRSRGRSTAIARFASPCAVAGGWGAAVYELADGDDVELQAPTGDFVLDLPDGDDLLMVAGGSGVTPFRTFIEELTDREHQGRITLIHACASPADFLFADEFATWSAVNANITYVALLSRDDDDTWDGERGRVDHDMLASRIDDAASTTVYACGPKGLVDVAMDAAQALGVPDARRRREAW